jgi:hypothetical protein
LTPAVYSPPPEPALPPPTANCSIRRCSQARAKAQSLLAVPVEAVSASQVDQQVGAAVAIDGDDAFIGASGTDTAGSTYDTILSVFAGGSWPGAASIACNDHQAANITSRVIVPVAAGSSDLIRVAGFGATYTTGDGRLQVAFTPACACDWNQSGALSVQDIFDFLACYFGDCP